MDSPKHRGRPKKSDSSKTQEAIEVAVLVYEQEKTRAQVAELLDISVVEVGRRLGYARKHGLVEIRIRKQNNDLVSFSLKNQIKEFGIRHVRVVGNSLRDVGQGLAQFWNQHGKNNSKIIIDGGRTIREFVSAIPEYLFNDITVIPICADPPSDDSSSYELMARLCQKIRATPLKVPYHRSPQLNQLLRKVQREAKSAHFIFMGVGDFLAPEATPHDFVFHLGKDPKQLRKGYPDLAYILGNFAIRRDGDPLPDDPFGELMPRAIPSLDNLRRMAKKPDCFVAVAAYETAKTNAVETIIRSRAINTLVVSESLAVALQNRFEKTSDL